MENEDILIDIRDSIYDLNDSIDVTNERLELIYSGDLQIISELHEVSLSVYSLFVYSIFILFGLLFYYVFHFIFSKR